jgi:hypothetical protein
MGTFKQGGPSFVVFGGELGPETLEVWVEEFLFLHSLSTKAATPNILKPVAKGTFLNTAAICWPLNGCKRPAMLRLLLLRL